MNRHMVTILEKTGKFIATIMVSGIVAAGVSVYFTDKANVRIENSKLIISQKQKFVEAFDAAHSDVLAKLTMFNNDILSGRKSDSARRAEVIQALVKAELAANDIEDQLLPKNHSLVDAYKKELADIGEEVKIVDQPLAMGSIFRSISELLPLHDKINHEARKSMKVEGLF